jgi:hypothetical protein
LRERERREKKKADVFFTPFSFLPLEKQKTQKNLQRFRGSFALFAFVAYSNRCYRMSEKIKKSGSKSHRIPKPYARPSSSSSSIQFSDSETMFVYFALFFYFLPCFHFFYFFFFFFSSELTRLCRNYLRLHPLF